jgi:hypothetical protein
MAHRKAPVLRGTLLPVVPVPTQRKDGMGYKPVTFRPESTSASLKEISHLQSLISKSRWFQAGAKELNTKPNLQVRE